jgi:hypothetical protein
MRTALRVGSGEIAMPSRLRVFSLSFAFCAASAQALDAGATRHGLLEAGGHVASYDVTTFTLPLNAVTETGYPVALAPIDVDGDGDQDVIVVYSQSEVNMGVPLSILRNDGLGVFADITSSIFPAGARQTFGVNHFLIADFNEDSRDDLFVGDSGWDSGDFPGQQNVLLLSSGATGFVDATATHLPQLADFTHSATQGDVNGDGFLDIFVGNQNGGTPPSGSLTNSYLLLNNGSGSFTRSDLLPAPALDRSRSCSLLFDADGDGDPDLLLGSVNGLILFNPGNGDFTSAATTSFAAPAMVNTPLMLTAKALDLNDDGALDLVVTYDDSPLASFAMQALINDGSGHFTDQTSTRIPADLAGPITGTRTFTSNFALCDINGDSFTDILLQNGSFGADQRPILINDGAGAFVRQPASALGEVSIYPNTILGRFFPMDANGDGRLDIVMYDQRRNIPEYENFFALLTSSSRVFSDGFE